MTRVKVARSPELNRMAKSKVAERRPLCVHCGARMPAPDKPREDWLLPYGHRRPQDQEPCLGWKTKPPIAPPPPLARPAQSAPRPVVERMSVREWFDCIQRIAERITRSIPPRRARDRGRRRRAGAVQLVLFPVDEEGEKRRGQAVARETRGERLRVAAEGAVL